MAFQNNQYNADFSLSEIVDKYMKHHFGIYQHYSKFCSITDEAYHNQRDKLLNAETDLDSTLGILSQTFDWFYDILNCSNAEDLEKFINTFNEFIFDMYIDN